MKAGSRFRRWVAIGVLVLVASAALRPALAQTAPAAPQVQKAHRRRSGLIVGGSILFGVGWGSAIFLSAVMIGARCCGRAALEYPIPVLGPVTSGGPEDIRTLGILMTVAQAGGIVMFAFGLIGEDVPATSAAVGQPTVWLTPLLARDAGGMILTARW